MGSLFTDWRIYGTHYLGAKGQRALSRLWGKSADWKWPFWARFFARTFIRRNESLFEDAHQYRSINDWFTADLKPDYLRFRQLAPGDIGSPAHAYVLDMFDLRRGESLPVKNGCYTLQSLVGDAIAKACFPDGHAIGVDEYLSPRTRHINSAPCDMEIQEVWASDGRLESVGRRPLDLLPQLYRENRRVTVRCAAILPNGSHIPFTMTAVGAMMVGDVELRHADGRVLYRFPRDFSGDRTRHVRLDAPLSYKAGEIWSAFKGGGSTVITCFQPETVELATSLIGKLVLPGTKIARFIGMRPAAPTL